MYFCQQGYWQKRATNTQADRAIDRARLRQYLNVMRNKSKVDRQAEASIK